MEVSKEAVNETPKDMKTIIFFSTGPNEHMKSSECLINAIKADERCAHKLFFRPIMTNVYQVIRAEKDDEDIPHIVGCHEVLFIPEVRKDLIARLENTKNVVSKRNCMCFVNNKEKTDKVINWLLEETEDIEL